MPKTDTVRAMNTSRKALLVLSGLMSMARWRNIFGVLLSGQNQ